ncbi:MAG: S8 family serine peptidase [Kiritimatiellae bacterium]|nr:S8 family serine peptidase [Kiritimatiellia bacterium]
MSAKKHILAGLAVCLLALPGLAQSEHAARATAHVRWEQLREGDYKPDELIVGYRSSGARKLTTGARASHAAVSARVTRRFRKLNAERVTLPAGRSLAQLRAAAERLAEDEDVRYVEPNYRARALLTPNDPAFPAQLWGLGPNAIGAEAAWDVTTGSGEIVVAVIDTGISRTHKDLEANIWTNPGEIPGNSIDDDDNGYVDDVHGWDFVNDDNDPTDDHGHGTHCAGTIGAVGNNATGIVGVCWQVQLVGVKGLSASGMGWNDQLALCIEYVAWFNGQDGRPRIHLSNNSWGGGGESQAMQDAIELARQAGQLFMAAAGNDGMDNDIYPSFPSNYTNDNIIAVASLAQGTPMTRSDFSNYGQVTVDLGAPGSAIYSCSHDNDSGYLTKSGTSMATPHVAGAAALLWSHAPDMLYGGIRDALLDAARLTANQIPSLQGKCVTGGRLYLPSALAALNSLKVSPEGVGRLAGPPGGAFAPSSLSYTVVNAATSQVDWALSIEQPWLSADALGGSLTGGASQVVQVWPNVAAEALPVGVYTNWLAYTNLSSAAAAPLRREVRLKVSYNYQLQSTTYQWDEPDAESFELASVQLGTTAVTLPFEFRYHGSVYSNILVHAHGAISPLGWPAPGTANKRLPADTIETPLVLPHWDELVYTPSVSSVRFRHYTNGTARTVVTWSGMGLSQAGGSPKPVVDFQAVLYANTNENSDIAFHYRTAAQDDPAGAGRGATVGLQDDGAFLACEYTFNGLNAQYGPMELADRQALLFTWRERLPDTLAPSVKITPVAVSPGSDELDRDGVAIFELRFNEIVLGLTPGDLNLSGTTVTGAAVTSMNGGGERFLITVGGFREYGRIVLRLNGAAVTDLAGNLNAASASALAVVPVTATQLFDDFERGRGAWTTSTNVYAVSTTVGWEYGPPPDYTAPGLLWPTAAFDGTACWGTVLSNAYPASANMWLQSPTVSLGGQPVLDFRFASDMRDGDGAVVEANRGFGWENVTASGQLPASTEGLWQRMTIALPDGFANRAVAFRFRLFSAFMNDAPTTGAGLYIDAFRVTSLLEAGIHLIAVQPATIPAGSDTLLDTFVYNACTQSLAQAAGVYGSFDSAMTVLSNGVHYYGIMLPGDIVSNRTVGVRTATADQFAMPYAYLTHDGYNGADFAGSSQQALNIAGVTESVRDRYLTVQASIGVTNWLGQFLAGDGGPAACLFQVIHAGADGVANPPMANGAPTGDDRVLYARHVPVLPCGRFGAGSVPADVGRFDLEFAHALAAGQNVYVRAWDAPSFDQAVAAGDSSLYTLTGDTAQTHDFGGWIVDQPTQYRRDSNGDSMPDGWAIEHGLDPREASGPAPETMGTTGLIRGINDDAYATNNLREPRRAVLYGNSILVASRLITLPREEGAVMVYDTNGTRRLLLDGVSAGGSLYRFDPATLCVDAPRGRLIVGGDTMRASGGDAAARVLYLNMATNANGVVTNLTLQQVVPAFGSTGIYTDTGRFRYLRDVAADAAGNVYAADAQLVQVAAPYYYRVQRLDPDGSNAVVLAQLERDGADYQGGPSALAVDDANGWLYVADVEADRIERRGLADGSYVGEFGGYGTGLGQLGNPQGLSIGVGGRVYVMERTLNRLQIFSADGVGLAVYPPEALNAAIGGSDAMGYFNVPEGVFAVTGRHHRVVLADTGNDRVYAARLMLDADGDGMDDVWEDVVGLDSTMNDANEDPDGDCLVNLGEFRADTDPFDPDCNGNGGGDQWDMMQGNDPLAPGGPAVDPPNLVSLVAVPDGVLGAGSNVLLTATFSESISNASLVTLALSGGAFTPPLAMTRVSPTVYTLNYIVTDADEGDVYGTVAGAFDLEGLEQDPVACCTGVLFTVQAFGPEVVSVTSDALQPLLEGETVTVTVTFSEDVYTLADVTIELLGGAVTPLMIMTRISPTVYQFTYIVQAGDAGDVQARVSGATDAQGHAQIPEPYTSGTVFTVGEPEPFPPFSITLIGWNPLVVEWEVQAGGGYVLRAGPTPTGVWSDVTGTLTAPADGVLGYTNATPVESERFFRAIRLGP